jgi:WD40 repeat protein
MVCLGAIALPLAYMSLGRATAPAPSGRERVVLDRLPPGQRGILFRSTVPDDTFGKVAFVPVEHPDGPWSVTNISCDRVYFQRGRGVCEAIEGSFIPPYVFFVFDERFTIGVKRPLAGVPSRARISPDGRRAALTVFQSGHSYAEGGFSTATTIHDAATGEAIANLESFTVWRDGKPFDAVDFNFWGVTFADDGNRFYATLRTANVNYLVEGDVDRHEATVIHTGVECPSLSPDNRRIAFKKRVTGSDTVFWQIAVLPLDTLRETVLDAESRSVDDQVDWLDDQHIVYHLPKTGGADIWALRVDHAEPPRILVEGGYSPSIIR